MFFSRDRPVSEKFILRAFPTSTRATRLSFLLCERSEREISKLSNGKVVKAVCKKKGCCLHKGTGAKEVDGVTNTRKPPVSLENPSTIGENQSIAAPNVEC